MQAVYPKAVNIKINRLSKLIINYIYIYISKYILFNQARYFAYQILEQWIVLFIRDVTLEM